jgi:hypothetical protein
MECLNKECEFYDETYTFNCGPPGIPHDCPSCLTEEKAPVVDVLCNVGLKGRLITAAASLSLHKLSEFDDDYPRKFPKWVLRGIEKHNDHLGDIARELMSIKDAL